jgi:hypothetical protein
VEDCTYFWGVNTSWGINIVESKIPINQEDNQAPQPTGLALKSLQHLLKFQISKLRGISLSLSPLNACWMYWLAGTLLTWSDAPASVTQEYWHASPDSDFPLWLTSVMVHFRGWCRTIISLGNGPDSHSLGHIHSLQVALFLVPEEWPGVGNGPGSTIRDKHSLGKIYSFWVVLCLVLEEWPRMGNDPGSEIRTFIIPFLRRIVKIDHH